MNYRAVVYYLGLVFKMEAAFMILPMCVSYAYREHMSAWGFFASMMLLLFISLLLDAVRVKNKNIYAREGLFVVSVCWIGVSLFGALPYWISGAIPSFANALFESVSGFSTTAASIVPDVELLPRGLLFWRNFSLWIGGMGVLMFLMAIIPMASGGRSMHMLRAELPGHSPGKLVPKLRQSSGILYAIYFGLTVAQVIFLILGGMPVFDSVLNAMGTTATGGFSIRNGSIAAYNSVYLESVIIVFMILSGINFNIHYFFLARNLRAIKRNDEIKWYLGIFFVAGILVTANLFNTGYAEIETSARRAFFHVASIMTTTGFTTADFSVWPQFSKGILFFLMFLGACSGSTGGGLKVSRVLILLREIRQVLSRIAHPNSVGFVKLDGKPVERDIVYSVCVYIMIIMLIFGSSVLIVSFDNFDFETTVTSVAACLNNIGAGFGVVSHDGSFAAFSALSKVVLCVNMLLGRLEMYPVMMMLFPSNWRKA